MGRHKYQLRGLLGFCFGTKYCAVVYFALAIALRTVTGIAWRLAAILTFISCHLSNQNIDQRGMDRILTFFRSPTFRAYRRRHMNFTFRPNWELAQRILSQNGCPKGGRDLRHAADGQKRPKVGLLERDWARFL